MVDIIMAKYVFWHPAVSDPLDHGGMVSSVRVDLTA